jgi:hypothetical protein
VKAVFEDLFAFHNLTDTPTTTILYSGSSAGGIGVTHTIDWIKNLFFSKAKFWGNISQREGGRRGEIIEFYDVKLISLNFDLNNSVGSFSSFS